MNDLEISAPNDFVLTYVKENLGQIIENLVNKSDDFNFIRYNYEKLRVGRTNAIKRSSRYQGYINHLGNPILKSLRNLMLKNTDIAMRRTKNIYNYEPLRIINNL